MKFTGNKVDPIFNEIYHICLAGFIGATLGFYFLTKAQKLRFKFLRSIVFVPARKSSTNAVQLGGLPLSLAIFAGILYLRNFSHFGASLTFYEQRVLNFGAYSSLFITLYGYLDDKYELRPIVKLILQVSCVFVFSVLSSEMMDRFHSTVAFLVMMFWGLGVVNGSNLLDGLDTLTIKLSIPTLGTYFALGYFFQSTSVMAMALIVASPILAFYFFNKEPAKIHLGEIGGSYIGFTYLVSSCLLFLRVHPRNSIFFSASVALMPLTLPMVELGISFLRRLYNKKGPFAGDKLHVHHILNSRYKFGPSLASTVFSIIYISCLSVSLGIGYFWHPLAGLASLISSLCACYLFIGAKYWKGDNTIEFTAQNLFNFLRKKDVMIINSQEIEKFQIILLEHEDEDDLDEELIPDESMEEASQFNKKKAS